MPPRKQVGAAQRVGYPARAPSASAMCRHASRCGVERGQNSPLSDPGAGQGHWPTVHSAWEGDSVALRGSACASLVTASRELLPVGVGVGKRRQVDHARHHVRQRFLHRSRTLLDRRHLGGQSRQLGSDLIELGVPRCGGPDQATGENQKRQRWRVVVERLEG